jgi:hypothetical protein
LFDRHQGTAGLPQWANEEIACKNKESQRIVLCRLFDLSGEITAD